MGVVAHHVKQPALVHVGQSGCGKVKGPVDGRHQRGTVHVHGVKRPGFDQGLQRALVQPRLVHANTEVEQALEGAFGGALRPFTAAFARSHHRLYRLLTGALDSTQTIAYDLVGHRLETVGATVDVRRLKTQTEVFDSIFIEHLELVGVVHFHRHVGAEKLRRVMDLEPAGVVRQQGIGSRVRLVEAVACKLLHQVEDLVRLVLIDTLFSSPLAEDGPMLGHFFGLFLAHGAAQHVGAAKAVATQHLGGLHHLLLVHHDPVGFSQHRLHQRMWVFHRLFPVLAVHEGGDQVHRPWAVQRVQRDQILQTARARLFEHALHASAFKLEHGLRFAVGEQPVSGAIVQRYVLVGKVFLALVALDDEFARNLQDGERSQPQEVELHKANGFHIVLVVLAHCRFAAWLLV